MQIEVPEGIEIEAIRQPLKGEVTFPQYRTDDASCQALIQVENVNSFSVVPILRPAAGYEFLPMFESGIADNGDIPLYAVKRYDTPKCLMVRYYVKNSLEEMRARRHFSDIYPPLDVVIEDANNEPAAVSETTGQLAAQ